jgi:hypothetical protein
MGEGRLESKTLIKGARPLVLCVDKNRSHTGNLSRPKRTEAKHFREIRVFRS